MRTLLFCFITFSIFQPRAWAIQKLNDQSKNTYREIKNTLGFVPSFFKEFPQSAISPAWENLKKLEFNSDTTLSNKYKELLAIAVTSSSQCSNCLYFHKEMAKLRRASQEEIQEAMTMAAYTNRWSAILNGSEVDNKEFQNDISTIIKNQKVLKDKEAMEVEAKPIEVKKTNDAYLDIQSTFGLIPTYLKNYPKQNIVGAWKEIKSVELNTLTEIPLKYKQLIGLAVASQIPCKYLIFYHKQKAIALGAQKEEIDEAIVMAGLSQYWETIINGQSNNTQNFKREVDQMVNFLRSKSQREASVKEVYSPETL